MDERIISWKKSVKAYFILVRDYKCSHLLLLECNSYKNAMNLNCYIMILVEFSVMHFNG